jgi:hypothetical protein
VRKGESETSVVIDGLVAGLEVGGLTVHFGVEDSGFDGAAAAQAPAGVGELGNEVELGLADGLKRPIRSLYRHVPAGLAFVLADECLSLAAVRPCFSAFSEDLRLPSSVAGPRDFAPLMRAASDLVMLLLLPARG